MTAADNRDPLPPRALVALLVDVLDRPSARRRFADGEWGNVIPFATERRHRTGDGGSAA